MSIPNWVISGKYSYNSNVGIANQLRDGLYGNHPIDEP